MNDYRLSGFDLLRMGLSTPILIEAGEVLPSTDEAEFGVAEFLAGLRFRHQALQLDTDYVLGRRMKSRVVARSDGTGLIETLGRGKAALRWIARLKGAKPLLAVR